MAHCQDITASRAGLRLRPNSNTDTSKHDRRQAQLWYETDEKDAWKCHSFEYAGSELCEGHETDDHVKEPSNLENACLGADMRIQTHVTHETQKRA